VRASGLKWGAGSSDGGAGSSEGGTGSSDGGAGSSDGGAGSSEGGTGSSDGGTGNSDGGAGSSEPGAASAEVSTPPNREGPEWTLRVNILTKLSRGPPKQRALWTLREIHTAKCPTRTPRNRRRPPNPATRAPRNNTSALATRHPPA